MNIPGPQEIQGTPKGADSAGGDVQPAGRLRSGQAGLGVDEDQQQLEYFLAVVEHGGFTAAALALHVAQPSLSHAIRTLEREFGGQFFHRLPHGVALTAAGEALVRQVLRDLSTARSLVGEVLGLGSGRLDIVSQTTLSVDPLAGMLGRFHRAHPKVAVRVVDPEQGPAVAHMVAAGQCELGLVDASVPTGDLRGIDLPEQEMRVVLPSTTRIRRATPSPRANSPPWT
ncbi:LysR family transcriptional regulator [Streptomyces acidiscabies]|uniref:LysR family transcriptional regulator n=1 Tax=Streptomyces acidiscabies TaxID=42234 RepID=UPI0030CF2025